MSYFRKAKKGEQVSLVSASNAQTKKQTEFSKSKITMGRTLLTLLTLSRYVKEVGQKSSANDLQNFYPT